MSATPQPPPTGARPSWALDAARRAPDPSQQARDQADLYGALRRAEHQADALRETTVELRSVLPTRLEAAVGRALTSSPPATAVVGLAEAVSATGDAVRALEAQLLDERLGRVEDLEVLVDLVEAGARTTRSDIAAVERTLLSVAARVSDLQLQVDALLPALADIAARLDRPVRIAVSADPAAVPAPEREPTPLRPVRARLERADLP